MNSTDNPTLAAAMILGEVASTGLARGSAVLCDCARRSTAIPRREVSEAEARTEMDRFDAAVVAAEGELLAVQDRVRRTLGEDEAEVFEVQILLMRDVQLRDAVRALCLEKRMNVEAAVDEAIKQLSALFASLEDPYFRERASDLHDVGRRLLDQLAQGGAPISPTFPDGCVVVTGDLLASVVPQLEGRGVRALIVEKGGLTTHATILARSLGIPMLVHVANASEQIRNGDLVIVDALAGRIFVNPEAAIVDKYAQLQVDLQVHRSALKDLVELPAITLDGSAIKLSANVGQTADAVAAASVKAEGVGLYRTEFVFMVQDRFPSEDEQYKFRFPDLGGNPVGTLDEGEGHSCPGFRMREILQGELLEERADSAIMSWAGHPVNFYGQGVGQRVRFDVSGRNEQFANERTCVVLLLQVAAQ